MAAGDRNNFGAGHVIASNGSNNMGADVYSPIISIQACRGFSIHTNVNENAGACNGAIYFQVSNDASNWVNLTLTGGGSSISVAGASRNDFTNFYDINAMWFRVFYDRTSGTGKLDAYCYVNRTR